MKGTLIVLIAVGTVFCITGSIAPERVWPPALLVYGAAVFLFTVRAVKQWRRP